MHTRRSAPSAHGLVIAGMWILFAHEVLKSFSIIIMPVAYSGFFVLGAAVLALLGHGALSAVQARFRPWVIGIWIYSSWMLLYGALESHSLQFIARDVWPHAYFACFLLAAYTDRWSTLDRMIYRQFVAGLAVVLLVLAVQDTPLDRTSLELSDAAWSGPRLYWASTLLFGWQYLFLTLNGRLPAFRRTITICGIVVYVGLNLIMLKRQTILELGLLTMCKLLYGVRIERLNMIRWATWVTAAVIVGVLALGAYARRENINYIDQLYQRSTEAGSLLNTTVLNTRLHESRLRILEQASAFEVLFGQGFGSSVVKDEVVDNVVESGLLTFILKGGLVYVALWYAGLLGIVWTSLVREPHAKAPFGFLSAVFVVGSVIAPVFIDHPSTGLRMLWLGRGAARLNAHRATPHNRKGLPAEQNPDVQ